MAQQIANQFPVDLQPNTAVGVSINFTGGGDAVFNPNYSTQDQIKSNLINYFLTNKGERPMQPNFGANLREFVFEQLNDSSNDLLLDRVQSEIETNFPAVSLQDLQLTTSEELNTVTVIIKYSINPFGIQDQLNLTFA